MQEQADVRMAWELQLAEILSKLQNNNHVPAITANDSAGGSVTVTPTPSTGQVYVEFPCTPQYAAADDFSVLAGVEGAWQ